MNKIVIALLAFLSIGCGKKNDTPIFYNTCSKSDSFDYRQQIDFVLIQKTDSLYEDFCGYLSDTKNFTQYKSPKNLRPNDTYRFDFYYSKKKIKSIHIHRWIDPEFYLMDDIGWDKTYAANIENTRKILRKLSLINDL